MTERSGGSNPSLSASQSERESTHLGDDWKGDLLIGSMTPGGLVRLDMEGRKVVKETRYLGELRERIRDVQQAADGSIYLITDSPIGKVLRLQPTAP